MSGRYIKLIKNLPWGILADGITLKRDPKRGALMLQLGDEVVWNWPFDFYDSLDSRQRWEYVHDGGTMYYKLYRFLKNYFDLPRTKLYSLLDDYYVPGVDQIGTKKITTRTLVGNSIQKTTVETPIYLGDFAELRHILLAADSRIGIWRLTGLLMLTDSHRARRVISYRIRSKQKCTPAI